MNMREFRPHFARQETHVPALGPFKLVLHCLACRSPNRISTAPRTQQLLYTHRLKHPSSQRRARSLE